MDKLHVAAAAAVLATATLGAAQESRPTTRPGGHLVAFRPGVTINWPQRQVEVAARVILRAGLIELLVCSPRIREHESILRIEARPYHVYQALGLIGLAPGHPLRWDEQKQQPIPPAGDPVEIWVRYARGGQAVTVSAWDWLARSDGKPLEEKKPWVFAGSLTGPDGSFAADFEGTVVAVVDFPDALLAVPELHSADNSELWLEPNTERIPPVGTSCTLILRPVKPAAAGLTLRLDRFARLTVGDQAIEPDELKPLVLEYSRSAAQPLVRLIVSPETARPDVDRWIARLKDWGVPAESLVVQEEGSSSLGPHEPEALRALVRTRVELGGELMKDLTEQRRMLTERISRSTQTMRTGIDAGGQIVGRALRNPAKRLGGDQQDAAQTQPTSRPVEGEP